MTLISRSFFLAAVMLGLAACGGGSSGGTGGTTVTPEPTASCDPADSSTADACGTVYVALTDADGDFLHYEVDVRSLTLETANGRIVETLPRTTRINFTDYVDLTELVTSATVPPGTYVAGAITLDYSAAEVFVEEGDLARETIVIDETGAELDTETFRVRLSNRDRLVVTRGRPAFLQLDFDLEASHTVDLVPEPATATAESFIVAEVVPVDEKTIRVRGPVRSVDVEAMTYTVAIRPFRDRIGDFGPVTVNVGGDTEFEVNGEMYAGAAGLEALEAAGPGTPSVAVGTLDLEEREFTAELELAGSSVPGIENDAVAGNIIARDGHLQGASQWLVEIAAGGIHIQGADNVPAAGPLLFVGNHGGLGDAHALLMASPRRDTQIFANDFGILTGLPIMGRHVIVVDMNDGYAALRAALRHLRAGKSLLLYPRGAIEADPGLDLDDALNSLRDWSRSLEFFARNVPGLAVVPVAVGGLLSRRALRNPVVRRYRDRDKRHFLAATFQMMFPYYRDPVISLAFGEPLRAEDASHEQVTRAMEGLLKRVSAEQRKLMGR